MTTERMEFLDDEDTQKNLPPGLSACYTYAEARTEQEEIESNPFHDLFSMRITPDMVKGINDARFAWLKLIPEGHIVAVCAKPNGGKTTVFTHAAADMAKDGYAVVYINADASAGDLRDYCDHATDHGYTLINPDMSGKNNEFAVETLKKMAARDENYSNTVLILDTLKKFTDMMAKNKGKAFYSMLRSLSTKGMTVIALAHTNKYDGEDGMPMYEGTADLRSDCDDLIYLIPVKNPDGSMTVSTMIDKSRAALEETTFQIDANRTVSVLESHVDTYAIARHKKSLEADSDAIAFITDAIKGLSKTTREIFNASKVADMGFSRRYIESVLKRYASDICKEPLWLSMKGITNGTRYASIADQYRDELTIEHRGV